MGGVGARGVLLAAALGMVAAAPASVSAKGGARLKLEAGGSGLRGGAPISASSTSVTLANSLWNLTCSEGELKGRVDTNLAAKDTVDPITGGVFQGGGNAGLCASTFEFVVSFTPVRTPELLLDRNGHAVLRYARLSLVPTVDVGKPEIEDEACNVVANGLKGTFPVSEAPQPLLVTFTGAKTHMETIRGAECGIEAPPLLTGSFAFVSHGSPVYAVLATRR